MNRLIITVLSLTITVSCFAQGNLPSTQGFWQTAVYNDVNEFDYFFYYRMVGDTIIDNTLYRKVFQSSVISELGFGYFEGGMREEDGVVYFYSRNGTEEHILYDYNLELGDTVEFVNTGFPVIVEHVDSIELEDGYHKRLEISDGGGYAVWIEGIGNSEGLLIAYYGASVSGFWNLVCMSSENEYSYQNPSLGLPSNACSIITGTEEARVNENVLAIQPNPFKESAIIRFEAQKDFNELKIYDICGSLIKQEDISGSDSYTLNREQMPNGIYFLQLSNDKRQLSTAKIVTQ